MAEDLRVDDSTRSLKPQDLIDECRRQEENCLYTSATFYIWLRWLRVVRTALWLGGAVGSTLAASHIVRGAVSFPLLAAAAALAGVLLPALVRALRLDTAIRDYSSCAATLKNLQDEFRRAATIWSQKSISEFESEARKLFKAMNDARKPSLTPPEFCFRAARKKIKRGHYSHGVDEHDTSDRG